MLSKAGKLLKWGAVVLVASAVTLLAVRVYDTQSRPPLELWHTYTLHELTAGEIDKSGWAEYTAAEGKIFAEVRTEVTDRLSPESRNAGNRYFADSPIYPGKFATDWNRCYIMASLYGLNPDPNDADYGVNLGSMATRGERGALIVSLDSLFRMPSNPIFPYMIERIEEGIGKGVKPTPGK